MAAEAEVPESVSATAEGEDGYLTTGKFDITVNQFSPVQLKKYEGEECQHPEPVKCFVEGEIAHVEGKNGISECGNPLETLSDSKVDKQEEDARRKGEALDIGEASVVEEEDSDGFSAVEHSKANSTDHKGESETNLYENIQPVTYELARPKLNSEEDEAATSRESSETITTAEDERRVVEQSCEKEGKVEEANTSYDTIEDETPDEQNLPVASSLMQIVTESEIAEVGESTISEPNENVERSEGVLNVSMVKGDEGDQGDGTNPTKDDKDVDTFTTKVAEDDQYSSAVTIKETSAKVTPNDDESSPQTLQKCDSGEELQHSRDVLPEETKTETSRENAEESNCTKEETTIQHTQESLDEEKKEATENTSNLEDDNAREEVLETSGTKQETGEHLVGEIHTESPQDFVDKETNEETSTEYQAIVEAADLSTNTEEKNLEEQAIPELSSPLVVEETATEIPREEETGALILKEEKKEEDAECNEPAEVASMTHETQSETTEDTTEPNKDLSGPISEESNKTFVENISTLAEVSETATEKHTQEKDGLAASNSDFALGEASHATGMTEEAETENDEQKENIDTAPEEKGQATILKDETASEVEDIGVQAEENCESKEKLEEHIPTAADEGEAFSKEAEAEIEEQINNSDVAAEEKVLGTILTNEKSFDVEDTCVQAEKSVESNENLEENFPTADEGETCLQEAEAESKDEIKSTDIAHADTDGHGDEIDNSEENLDKKILAGERETSLKAAEAEYKEQGKHADIVPEEKGLTTILTNETPIDVEDIEVETEDCVESKENVEGQIPTTADEGEKSTYISPEGIEVQADENFITLENLENPILTTSGERETGLGEAEAEIKEQIKSIDIVPEEMATILTAETPSDVEVIGVQAEESLKSKESVEVLETPGTKQETGEHLVGEIHTESPQDFVDKETNEETSTEYQAIVEAADLSTNIEEKNLEEQAIPELSSPLVVEETAKEIPREEETGVLIPKEEKKEEDAECNEPAEVASMTHETQSETTEDTTEPNKDLSAPISEESNKTLAEVSETETEKNIQEKDGLAVSYSDSASGEVSHVVGLKEAETEKEEQKENIDTAPEEKGQATILKDEMASEVEDIGVRAEENCESKEKLEEHIPTAADKGEAFSKEAEAEIEEQINNSDVAAEEKVLRTILTDEKSFDVEDTNVQAEKNVESNENLEENIPTAADEGEIFPKEAEEESKDEIKNADIAHADIDEHGDEIDSSEENLDKQVPAVECETSLKAAEAEYKEQVIHADIAPEEKGLATILTDETPLDVEDIGVKTVDSAESKENVEEQIPTTADEGEKSTYISHEDIEVQADEYFITPENLENPIPTTSSERETGLGQAETEIKEQVKSIDIVPEEIATISTTETPLDIEDISVQAEESLKSKENVEEQIPTVADEGENFLKEAEAENKEQINEETLNSQESSDKEKEEGTEITSTKDNTEREEVLETTSTEQETGEHVVHEIHTVPEPPRDSIDKETNADNSVEYQACTEAADLSTSAEERNLEEHDSQELSSPLVVQEATNKIPMEEETSATLLEEEEKEGHATCNEPTEKYEAEMEKNIQEKDGNTVSNSESLSGELSHVTALHESETEIERQDKNIDTAAEEKGQATILKETIDTAQEEKGQATILKGETASEVEDIGVQAEEKCESKENLEEHIPTAADKIETFSKEAEAEEEEQINNGDVAAEEKVLETILTNEKSFDVEDTNVQAEKNVESIENLEENVPTAADEGETFPKEAEAESKDEIKNADIPYADIEGHGDEIDSSEENLDKQIPAGECETSLKAAEEEYKEQVIRADIAPEEKGLATILTDETPLGVEDIEVKTEDCVESKENVEEQIPTTADEGEKSTYISHEDIKVQSDENFITQENLENPIPTTSSEQETGLGEAEAEIKEQVKSIDIVPEEIATNSTAETHLDVEDIGVQAEESLKSKENLEEQIPTAADEGENFLKEAEAENKEQIDEETLNSQESSDKEKEVTEITNTKDDTEREEVIETTSTEQETGEHVVHEIHTVPEPPRDSIDKETNEDNSVEYQACTEAADSSTSAEEKNLEKHAIRELSSPLVVEEATNEISKEEETYTALLEEEEKEGHATCNEPSEEYEAEIEKNIQEKDGSTVSNSESLSGELSHVTALKESETEIKGQDKNIDTAPEEKGKATISADETTSEVEDIDVQLKENLELEEHLEEQFPIAADEGEIILKEAEAENQEQIKNVDIAHEDVDAHAEKTVNSEENIDKQIPPIAHEGETSLKETAVLILKEEKKEEDTECNEPAEVASMTHETQSETTEDITEPNKDLNAPISGESNKIFVENISTLAEVSETETEKNVQEKNGLAASNSDSALGEVSYVTGLKEAETEKEEQKENIDTAPEEKGQATILNGETASEVEDIGVQEEENCESKENLEEHIPTAADKVETFSKEAEAENEEQINNSDVAAEEKVLETILINEKSFDMEDTSVQAEKNVESNENLEENFPTTADEGETSLQEAEAESKDEIKSTDIAHADTDGQGEEIVNSEENVDEQIPSGERETSLKAAEAEYKAQGKHADIVPEEKGLTTILTDETPLDVEDIEVKIEDCVESKENVEEQIPTTADEGEKRTYISPEDIEVQADEIFITQENLENPILTSGERETGLGEAEAEINEQVKSIDIVPEEMATISTPETPSDVEVIGVQAEESLKSNENVEEQIPTAADEGGKFLKEAEAENKEQIEEENLNPQEQVTEITNTIEDDTEREEVLETTSTEQETGEHVVYELHTVLKPPRDSLDKEANEDNSAEYQACSEAADLSTSAEEKNLEEHAIRELSSPLVVEEATKEIPKEEETYNTLLEEEEKEGHATCNEPNEEYEAEIEKNIQEKDGNTVSNPESLSGELSHVTALKESETVIERKDKNIDTAPEERGQATISADETTSEVEDIDVQLKENLESEETLEEQVPIAADEGEIISKETEAENQEQIKNVDIAHEDVDAQEEKTVNSEENIDKQIPPIAHEVIETTNTLEDDTAREEVLETTSTEQETGEHVVHEIHTVVEPPRDSIDKETNEENSMGYQACTDAADLSTTAEEKNLEEHDIQELSSPLVVEEETNEIPKEEETHATLLEEEKEGHATCNEPTEKYGAEIEKNSQGNDGNAVSNSESLSGELSHVTALHESETEIERKDKNIDTAAEEKGQATILADETASEVEDIDVQLKENLDSEENLEEQFPIAADEGQIISKEAEAENKEQIKNVDIAHEDVDAQAEKTVNSEENIDKRIPPIAHEGETSLKEAEAEDKEQVTYADIAPEEKGLATILTDETPLEAEDIGVKAEESFESKEKSEEKNPIAADEDETFLKEAEAENKEQIKYSDIAPEDKGLATILTDQKASNIEDIGLQAEETFNSSKNLESKIPSTADEHETSLKEAEAINTEQFKYTDIVPEEKGLANIVMDETSLDVEDIDVKSDEVSESKENVEEHISTASHERGTFLNEAEAESKEHKYNTDISPEQKSLATVSTDEATLDVEDIGVQVERSFESKEDFEEKIPTEDETFLKEAEAETKEHIKCSDIAPEEKGLADILTDETSLDVKDIEVKEEESFESNENLEEQIQTAEGEGETRLREAEAESDERVKNDIAPEEKVLETISKDEMALDIDDAYVQLQAEENSDTKEFSDKENPTAADEGEEKIAHGNVVLNDTAGVQILEEAEPKVGVEEESCKSEAQPEKTSTIVEEVFDESKITGRDFNTEEFVEGNVACFTQESIGEDTVNKSQEIETENKNLKEEGSCIESLKEGSFDDLSPEYIREDESETLKDDQKDEVKSRGEILKESQADGADESIKGETTMIAETSEQIVTSPVKYEEGEQGESSSPVSKEEGSNEDTFSTKVAKEGDGDNGAITVIETSADVNGEEGLPQAVQKYEPVEGHEKMLDLMPEESKTESSENAEVVTCTEEEIKIQNIQESLDEEKKEEETTPVNDMKENETEVEEVFEIASTEQEMGEHATREIHTVEDNTQEFNDKETAEENLNEYQVSSEAADSSTDIVGKNSDEEASRELSSSLVEEDTSAESSKQEENYVLSLKEEENEATHAPTSEEQTHTDLKGAKAETKEQVRDIEIDHEEKGLATILTDGAALENVDSEEFSENQIPTVADEGEYNTELVGDKAVDESFQVQSLEEAEPKLRVEDESRESEDHPENNTMIVEEPQLPEQVLDEPKSTGGDFSEGQTTESNAAICTPERIQEETAKNSQDSDKETENLMEEGSSIESVKACNTDDPSQEFILDDGSKKFDDDKQDTVKFEGEILKETEIAGVGESTTYETNQIAESSGEISGASPVKYEEGQPGEGSSQDSEKASKDEDVTEDDDNNGALTVTESSAEVTSKGEEESAQALEKSEPEEEKVPVKISDVVDVKKVCDLEDKASFAEKTTEETSLQTERHAEVSELVPEKLDVEATEEEFKESSEIVPESDSRSIDVVSKDEIVTSQTLDEGISQEQVEIPSSTLLTEAKEIEVSQHEHETPTKDKNIEEEHEKEIPADENERDLSAERSDDETPLQKEESKELKASELALEKLDAGDTEEGIKESLKTISKSDSQSTDAVSKDEIVADQTHLEASYALLPMEEELKTYQDDRETTTQDKIIEEEYAKKTEVPADENGGDLVAATLGEETLLKEEPRELKISELAPENLDADETKEVIKKSFEKMSKSDSQSAEVVSGDETTAYQTELAGDKAVEESFQVQSLEEAEPKLRVEDESRESEDHPENDNIIVEEPQLLEQVLDEPKSTDGDSCEGQTTKRNAAICTPERIQEGTAKNSQDSDKETENSQEEILKEPEIAGVGESTTYETNQIDETSEEIFDASPLKYEGRPGERSSQDSAKASKEEDVTEDHDSNGAVTVTESNAEVTSKGEEDSAQPLEKYEPEEEKVPVKISDVADAKEVCDVEDKSSFAEKTTEETSLQTEGHAEVSELAPEKLDVEATEEEFKEGSEIVHESDSRSIDVVSKDEIATSQTLDEGISQEQVEILSSTLLTEAKEIEASPHEHETPTRDKNIEKEHEQGMPADENAGDLSAVRSEDETPLPKEESEELKPSELALEKLNAGDTEEEIKETFKTISKSDSQSTDAVPKDEIVAVQTHLEASYASLPKEEELKTYQDDRETTTQDKGVEEEYAKETEVPADENGRDLVAPTLAEETLLQKEELEELKVSELAPENLDAGETEEEIKESFEKVSKSDSQSSEVVSGDETTAYQTLHEGISNEQLQLPSSTLVPEEKEIKISEREHETTTQDKNKEDGSTEKNEVPADENTRDLFVAVTSEEETFLHKEEPREFKACELAPAKLHAGETEEIKESLETISKSDSQCIDTVSKDDIVADQTLVGASYTSFPKEKEHEAGENEVPADENGGDLISARSVEETILQKEEPGELKVSELAPEELNAGETEEEIKKTPERVSKPESPSTDVVSRDEAISEQTLHEGISTEKLQIPSSVLLPEEKKIKASEELGTTFSDKNIEDNSSNLQMQDDENTKAISIAKETSLIKEEPRELKASDFELHLTQEVPRESSNEEITEDEKLPEESEPDSVREESHHENKAKAEKEGEQTDEHQNKLSEVDGKGIPSEKYERQLTFEDLSIKEHDPCFVEDKTIQDGFPEEEKRVEEAAFEFDLKNQEDETNSRSSITEETQIEKDLKNSPIVETSQEFEAKDTKSTNDTCVAPEIKERIQVGTHSPEEKEPTAISKEQKIEEDEEEEHESTDEVKVDEEKGEKEHKTGEPGYDSPIMVEASRDADVNVKVVSHKKSNHILSGIKHSISKVKKAITGKSSHSKTKTEK